MTELYPVHGCIHGGRPPYQYWPQHVDSVSLLFKNVWQRIAQLCSVRTLPQYLLSTLPSSQIHLDYFNMLPNSTLNMLYLCIYCISIHYKCVLPRQNLNAQSESQLCSSDISVTFSSHWGPSGEGYDNVSAVIQCGKEEMQPKAISEDKAGGCITSEKITYIALKG